MLETVALKTSEDRKLRETQQRKLLSDLLALKHAAIDEWSRLPPRQQRSVFSALQAQAAAKKLTAAQQKFILEGMVKIPWSELDMSGFETMLTDQLLAGLLQGSAKSLMILDISGCIQLTHASFDTILKYAPQLRQLHAQQAPWSIINISPLTHLQLLDLTDSRIKILYGNAPQLHTLFLENCTQLVQIGTKSANYPFSAPHLTELDLSGCSNLTDIYLPQALLFERFIPQLFPCTKLKVIYFHTQQKWIEVPDFFITQFRKGIPTLEIEISDALTSEQWVKFSYYLEYDRFLTRLELQSGNMEDEDILALADKLKINSTITQLDLSHNKIGDVGAIALTKILKNMTHLNLSHNKIGKEGMQKLAEAMGSNDTLLYLELEGNPDPKLSIGSNATITACLVRNRIKADPTLRFLDLAWNKIGVAGAQMLAKQLKNNTIVTQLDIEGNKIGDAGALELAEMLKTNTTLHSLHLQFNQISTVGIQKLAEALENNFTLINLSLSEDADEPKNEFYEKNLTGEKNLIIEAGVQALANINVYLKRNRGVPYQTTQDSSSQLVKYKSSPPLSTSVPSKPQQKSFMAPSPHPKATTLSPMHAVTRGTYDSKERKIPITTASRQHAGLTSPFITAYASSQASPDRKQKGPTKTINQSARFLSRNVPDEKIQKLLTTIAATLDDTYPNDLIEHRTDRQIYLAQLTEYQKRSGHLTIEDKEALKKILTTLQSINSSTKPERHT